MTIATIAQRIRDSHAQNTVLASLADTDPGLTIDEAYQVQLLNIAKRVEGGEVISGKKVGLSSEMMQTKFGVNEPDFGHLFTSTLVTSGTTSLATCKSPRIEVEIAACLATGLPTSDVTPEQALAAIDWVSASFELVDSRVGTWEMDITDTIADNASSIGYILGDIRLHPDELDLGAESMTLYRNDEVLNSGDASAACGHPAQSIAWLANALGRYDIALQPGEVILTGALSGALPVAVGETYRADFASLGSISVTYTA